MISILPDLRAFRKNLPAWPLLIAAVAVAFHPALDGSILSWDDHYYLSESAIQDTTCTFERLAWIFSHPYFGNYNPLHRVGYWIQVALLGGGPEVLHLVSLSLHAANALLLFSLARRLGLRREAALLAALLFAVHPTRVEPVAWISAQKDLGSALFALLALHAYVPILRGTGGRRLRPLLAVGVLFLLALLYKSQLVAFPLLLLVLDLAWRRPPGASIAEKIPFLLISGIFSVLTVGAAPRIGPLGGSWGSHVAKAMQAPWFYVERVFWPAGFSARFWIEGDSSVLSAGPLLGAALFLAFVLGFCIYFRRDRRLLLLSLAWPAAALLPVLNIVPIPIVVADRYLYLALLGPFLAAALWWIGREEDGTAHIRGEARRFLAGGALLVSLLTAWSHARAYRDTETLWRESLRTQPGNPVVRGYLALELVTKDPGPRRARESLELLQEESGDPQLSQNHHVMRSMACQILGDGVAAGAELDRAMELSRKGRLIWQTAVARARRFRGEGRFREAHEALSAFQPRWQFEEERIAEARSAVCQEEGDLSGCLRWNEKLLGWNPFSLILWHNQEVAARRLGLEGEARRCAARFEALKPRGG